MTNENNARTGSLEGKVALVTGGTSGIGLASALRLHAEGARVIATGRSAASIASARETLPRGVRVVASDARSVEDAARLADDIRANEGALDVVFLNAGIAGIGPFDAVTEASYAEHMDTNVKGVFFTIQKVLPLLRPGASIIVNTSVAGLKAAPFMSVYSASKGAVSALARTLAVELAPRGVRVNAISPATIHTAIQGKFGLPAEMQAEMERDYSTKIPLGRFGEVSEVTELVLFLAGKGASYVTGTEIPVDGGLLVA
jgi:NAD(P)-dependent dehydrogenase (short-subunit alcohol dehydrogenase family)